MSAYKVETYFFDHKPIALDIDNVFAEVEHSGHCVEFMWYLEDGKLNRCMVTPKTKFYYTPDYYYDVYVSNVI